MSALTVAASELEEDRFSRYRLLRWWDQSLIAETKVLVVGAGALGNEILKNLALLGFRRIVVVDLDKIELSNLSRSVLFRASDIGRDKTEAAATALHAIYEDVIVQPLTANIMFDVGLGLFRWADVILAGLDNREARLWINRAAWKTGRPWIDGAIEGLNGVARVFLPGVPPCYECTLGAVDWAILDRRMSCNLLTRAEMEAGKVATTPTTSSVIAGIQVQEALKLRHGLPVLSGQGFVFDGMNHDSYKVEYTENPDCMSHYTPETIVSLDAASDAITLKELHSLACAALGSNETVIEFSRDVIRKLVCETCHAEEDVFAPVGALSFSYGLCSKDNVARTVHTMHSYTGAEDFGSRRLSELGLPAWDLYIARAGQHEIGYIPARDASSVLGVLAESVLVESQR